jgi:hypothetical protein
MALWQNERHNRNERIEMVEINTSFDFRRDAGGKDPDSHSPTLRRYHQILWSKPLPNGDLFDLSLSTPGVYLHHRSRRGEFFLASDSVMATFQRWKRLKSIVQQIPMEDQEAFEGATYTIGGMMVFPGNQVDGKQTMNGARGFTPAIADRMDLTLECIRRHYLELDSPLTDTILRYDDFFALFEDFRGYVEFFLLEDLVADTSTVRFFMDFDDFRPPYFPLDLGAYLEFRSRSVAFVSARNRRIESLTKALN